MDNEWKVLQERVAERLDLNNPPFRYVTITFEGLSDEAFGETFEVPSGQQDGFLHLLVGSDSVSATLTWTISNDNQT